MKIGQSPESPLPVAPSVTPTPKAPAPAANSTAVASATTTAAKSSRSAGVAVTVSTLARTLEASSRGVANDVDLVKVESVRQSIDAGTYVVNPGVIAGKLLANAQEMLDRTRS